MKRGDMKMISVSKLHTMLEERMFAVPKLQREFVWDGNRAAKLLDSMYRQMPIGSLVVWPTTASRRYLLRKDLHVLPPPQSHAKKIWFLIDGQQRLSVLYQALKGERKPTTRGRFVDFSRLCFRLSVPKGDSQTSRFVYRKPIDGEYLSVQDILHPRWRSLLSYLGSQKIGRVKQCRERLLKYHVPVLFVMTNSIDQVREFFIRINSLGTPVRSADRAFARASSIDLRKMARETQHQLPPEFRELPDETILQAFAFVAGKSSDVGAGAYEAAIRQWEKAAQTEKGAVKKLARRWADLSRAMGKAVDYLKTRFSVLSEAFLPSANMVATLSVFFYHQKAQPSPIQAKEIKKWFWATGVCQRYSGRGYRENVKKDVEFFKRLATKGTARFAKPDPIDLNELRSAQYARSTSLANAFLCLLASRGPVYIENGQPIPQSVYASRANRKNQHHIYPRALLASKGVKHRQYNTIVNICLLAEEENKRFGSKRPSSYLKPYRGRRHFANAMRIHLIPHGPRAAVWRGAVKQSYKEFQQERMQLIRKAFELEAGMRLFTR
ncbi:MAG: DUF262 domain-containing protein [Armatimonadetes bacterium]|nr:MAG: DUF262 domain-containing protein [Armatimonadota bacterium]